MKPGILTLLLAGAALGARAQCTVSVAKSGTGLSRTYTASSAATGMNYTWYQAGYANSTGTSITRSYTYGGYYYLSMAGQKTSPFCTDSVSFVDTVAGPVNCSGLTASVYAYGSGQSYTFNSYINGTNGTTVPPGYTQTTVFNYGDGTSGSSPSHTYAANGVYTVTVTHTLTSPNYPSCTKTASTTVNIGGVSCGTSISKSGTGMVRTYTAVHPNYSTANWNHTWKTWPGGFANATGNSVTRTYTYGGYYLVNLDADLSSPVSCSDSASVRDTIAGPMDCSSTYAYLYVNGTGLTRTFSPSAGGSLAPGYAVSYSYNYGDGSTGSSSSHTYAAAGTYTVTLTATWAAAGTNYASCTKTSSTTVNVSQSTSFACSTATAAFTVSGTSPTFTFTNASTPTTLPSNVNASHYLDFGDNSQTAYFQTATSSTTHTYAQNGTFTVRLLTQYMQTVPPYAVICTKRDSMQVTVTNAPNNFDASVNWDSTSSPASVQVKFWLIQYDSTSQMLTAVDSAIGTSPGYSGLSRVLFTNKPNGSYRLKAHLLNQTPGAANGYLPTYYDNVATWNAATVMNCNNCGTTYAHWQLQQGTPVAGSGFVGGSVLSGANKGTTAGAPVAGQLVLLRDANNKMIRSAYTNASGEYSFTDVPAGDYTVYPEEMNYATTASVSFPITGFQNTKSGVSFRKNNNARTIVPAAAPTSVGGIQAASALRVHPNPSNGLVTVQLPAAGSDVTVRVTAVTGQEVYLQTVSASVAGKGWNIDLSQLPAGVYSLALKSAEGTQTEKLVLQR